MAHMLGFFKRNPRLDLLRQEERIRTWMSIYVTGLAYNIGFGKHYSISYINTDIPLWTPKVNATKTNLPLYCEDKYIVNSFRNFIIFAAIVERLIVVKQHRVTSLTKDPCSERKAFLTKLNRIEMSIFSWYVTLPVYLLSRDKINAISIPSSRNQFSCRLHFSMFYYILEINSLKLESPDWTKFSLQKIADCHGQIRASFSFKAFFELSPLEKCLVAAHFGVITISSARFKKAVYHGHVLKWAYAFQIVRFL
ncbi:hypothetical protein DSO57_1008050 [Entomophthora muscae]|uniref:Uncharacterized protein n=1 Tax=Entomophthora muscae TaxID=34485 RepID=A0ACC2RM93_9FUNG|nr:hypothetical protein DSO57_1008050 [Entomophthora muscae]